METNLLDFLKFFRNKVRDQHLRIFFLFCQIFALFWRFRQDNDEDNLWLLQYVKKYDFFWKLKTMIILTVTFEVTIRLGMTVDSTRSSEVVLTWK